MSRERKFRGMDLQGRWFHGLVTVLTKDSRNGPRAGTYISNAFGSPFAYAVRPETVGQYTGLKDKEGREIYEGDRLSHPSDQRPMTVVWHERTAGLGLARKGWMFIHFFHEAVDPAECTVIGNIHEPLLSPTS